MFNISNVRLLKLKLHICHKMSFKISVVFFIYILFTNCSTWMRSWETYSANAETSHIFYLVSWFMFLVSSAEVFSHFKTGINIYTSRLAKTSEDKKKFKLKKLPDLTFLGGIHFWTGWAFKVISEFGSVGKGASNTEFSWRMLASDNSQF